MLLAAAQSNTLPFLYLRSQPVPYRLQDHYDVKTLCHPILSKLAVMAPGQVGGTGEACEWAASRAWPDCPTARHACERCRIHVHPGSLSALTSPLPACPTPPAARSPLPWTGWWSRCRPHCRPRSRPTPVGGLAVVNRRMFLQNPGLGPTSLPARACLPSSSV